MLAGDVDADHQLPVIRRDLLPLRELIRGLIQNPNGDRLDQPGVLGDRDKFIRRDHPEFGVMPTQQCFESDESSVLEIYDRLVMNRGLDTSFRTMANSSPPIRATVSFLSTIRTKRRAAIMRTLSPIECPRLSLMFLKPLMSRNRTWKWPVGSFL